MGVKCRHALREPGCVDCTGYDHEHVLALRLDLIGACRHALKEPRCQDCKGLDCGGPESTLVLLRRTSIRQEIIRAASEDVKEAIKTWRKQWRSMAFVLCHWCKQTFAPDDCHADHVIPLSRGGPHSLSNLVIACATCNVRKSARMPDVWAEMIAAT